MKEEKELRLDRQFLEGQIQMELALPDQKKMHLEDQARAGESLASFVEAHTRALTAHAASSGWGGKVAANAGVFSLAVLGGLGAFASASVRPLGTWFTLIMFYSLVYFAFKDLTVTKTQGYELIRFAVTGMYNLAALFVTVYVADRYSVPNRR